MPGIGLHALYALTFTSSQAYKVDIITLVLQIWRQNHKDTKELVQDLKASE